MGDFAVWLDRQSYSERTKRQYLRRVADFEAWLEEHDRSLTGATWRDVRRYAEGLVNTYPTRQGFKSALITYYRSRGNREGRHAWAVPVPKRVRGMYRGFDTDSEKDRLLEAARSMGPTPYAMCCALYYQGLRREETARIRWDDIRKGTIHGIGKGNVAFELPLHERFIKTLHALEPSSPWVFPGRWPGTHVSPATVWLTVRLAGERAGLGRITPHQLRHTSVAKINDTIGLREAATFARHTDIQTTMIYTRTKRARLLQGMSAL